MLQLLKPTEAEIEELALAETDPAQRARFAPLRLGRLGNLLLIACIGGAGLAHATLKVVGRRVLPSTPHGRR